MTEYCAVIGPALYRARGATNCCKRSYQTPSLPCGTGCGHTRLGTRQPHRSNTLCAKLLSDCKEFDPEKIFLHYYAVVARSVHKDIWYFVYTFSNHLTALGARNALRSVE